MIVDGVPGAAPARVAGLPGDVHVWTAEVGAAGALDDQWALLDAHERATARRRRPSGQDGYVLAHALRRRLLAACTGIDPHDLEFSTDGRGHAAPVGSGRPRWHHNLSRSASHVAVAVARDRALGVDIEAPRPVRRAGDLAVRLLPPGSEPSGPAVLAAWVRWEALAKATGQGLARHLHPVPDELTTCGRRWRVFSLPHPGAQLALVLGREREPAPA